MKLTQEERQMLSKELKNLIDSEISRSNLVNAIRKDGGRIMCETIFLNRINTILELKAQEIESETEKRVIERVKSEIKKERKSDKESILWCDDVIFTYRRILDLPSLNPQPIKNNNN